MPTLHNFTRSSLDASFATFPSKNKDWARWRIRPVALGQKAVALLGTIVLTASALAAPMDNRFINISTRAQVSSGENVLIAGFVIGPGTAKKVLIRAVGPGLKSQGVTTALSDPVLTLFDSTGKSIATNASWSGNDAATFSNVGAFPLTAGSRDSSIVTTLDPGTYTAEVSAASTSGGVSLVEVYDVSDSARLMNISTRAQVLTGEGVLISGFVIRQTTGTRKLLLRASGPALTPLGVKGVLADPVLTVIGANGVKIASNDNWESDQKSALINAALQTGAFPFSAGSKDAALLVELPSGAYTVQVTSAKPGTGVALIEAYDLTPPPPVAPVNAVFRADGIDAKAYAAYNTAWDSNSMDSRLGPSFASRNPGATDTRPTNFMPTDKPCSLSFSNRTNPYEVGDYGCSADTDYWSESGQVAYIPDAPANDPGLDRIQVFAYYNQVFATSPRLDWASSAPHPEPQTRQPQYKALFGVAPTQPIAMVRGYGLLQNEALVLYRGGFLGIAGTQTSRAGSENHFPGIVFPANKVPTAIAVTTENELALITIWDTTALKGQLAVVALEGKYIPFHTLPYMGLPNEGSFSDMKLLGYVDLPIAAPSSVAAASNGFWNGPSQTNGEDLGQIDLAKAANRPGFIGTEYEWGSVVANKGYAIIASKLESQVVVVDLSPVINYFRNSYFGPNFDQLVASRGSGPGQFPLTFTENAASLPKVVWSSFVDTPTAVLAGLKLDRWSSDRQKAYVACESGTVHIIDTSSLMARWSWEKNSVLTEIGSLQVGHNPVSLAFTRFGESNLPVMPLNADGTTQNVDPLNNTFYAACRGDREIDAVVTYGGDGQVYRKISDTRLGDPVSVSVAGRGNIVTVSDFAGKQIISFRVGGLTDRNKHYYGAGADGKAAYEVGGVMSVKGFPFATNSANVN